MFNSYKYLLLASCILVGVNFINKDFLKTFIFKMKRSARKKLLGLTGLLAFSAVMMDPYDILRDEATLNDNCRYDWVESEVGVSSLGDPWTKAYEGRIEARIIEVEKDSNKVLVRPYFKVSSSPSSISLMTITDKNSNSLTS